LTLIDIGANLLDARFDADRDAVFARAAAELTAMLITGTDLSTSLAAIDYCKNHSEELQDNSITSAIRLGCTAGLHPHNASQLDAAMLAELSLAAAQPQVRAIGETGLDFNRNFSPPDAQRSAFAAQIEIAACTRLPLFVHDRDSNGAVADLLEASSQPLHGVVIHCFTGTEAELMRYLAAGYSIGITGWDCDERRGASLRELVPLIPIEQLMIETDAPYLWPRTAPDKPARGRNEPCFLRWIAIELARLRRTTPEQMAAATTANALRMFF
jgi:TatD DNase family protein